MGYHKMEQYSHYGSPKRNRQIRGAESLFKEITAENFPNLSRDMGNQGKNKWVEILYAIK